MMEEYMDNLVESMDETVENLGECFFKIVRFIVGTILLITLPVWYLPYKILKRKRHNGKK